MLFAISYKNGIILDELNIATYYNLFTVEEAIEAIKEKAPYVEVIITGRYAEEKIIQIADFRGFINRLYELKKFKQG